MRAGFRLKYKNPFEISELPMAGWFGSCNLRTIKCKKLLTVHDALVSSDL